jgi:hypothetical protein
MNSLRKILGLLMALMLATFAVTSFAASSTKVFFAQVQPFMASNATSVTITFFNTSPPPGLSTGNAIKVIAPFVGTTQLLKFTGLNITPGSSLELGPNGSYIVINNFPGINRGQSQTFTIGVTVIAPGCNAGTFGAEMKTGNSFNGDPFAPDAANMKLTSAIGCEFADTKPCGSQIDASVNGAGPNDPGYALVTIAPTLKDGSACTGNFAYVIQNSLLIDNKLVVTLTDPSNPLNDKAAFTADIVSNVRPVDATGYASDRLKVAYFKDSSQNWVYINAQTCLCAAPSVTCMPTNTVDPAPYLNQRAQACVGDYSWFTQGTGSPSNPALVKYFATVYGAGKDPAMGWAN